jgi:capsular exopolysaccharide synthesis family protein
MSHIQKILDRAERDGSIRPANGGAAVLTDSPVSSLRSSEAVFPITVADAIPEVAAPPAPATRVATARIDRRLLDALALESVTAEQFRSLATRIQQVGTGRAVNALLVTSPGRREGRTHTAASLALTMAQQYDRRVCLIDADLRHPQIRGLFGLPAGPGLSDVLAGTATLEDALVSINDYNLTVLPGGQPTSHAELLGTAAMRRTLQSLRTRFDRIVIDSPAALPLADVALLTPLVDALMLVVRAGVTAKPAIHQAVAAIDAEKLLGVVLNDAR